jgi:hypothetical protein
LVTALPTSRAATTVNQCFVRSSSRNNVIAQTKLAISVTSIKASHTKLRWKSFGHAEITLTKAGSAT